MSDDIKTLLEQQNEAFAALKGEVEASKKALGDVVKADKVERIEKSLDDAVEAVAKMQARVEAERKEREELELRLSRKGGNADDKAEALVKQLGIDLGRTVSNADYDAYKSGISEYLRKGEKSIAGDVFKAMSVGGDPDGGYLVTPDVTGRIATKVYESSPIRQIASVQVISTDKLEGIEDLGEGSASWVGETGARTATATPQVGKWSIEVFEMYAMPEATQKLLDDAAVDVEAWLGMKTADKFARAEANAFVVGDGVGKPKGFAGAYTTSADSGSGVTWGTLGHVISGADGGFAASNPIDKIYDLIGTVKNDYLGNARFVTRRSVITAMRKFKETTGGYLWSPPTATTPETFAGFPITRAEDIPALATNSLSLWFGDFRAGYQIVDRVGIRTLRDPYTNKPYVRFYTTKRVGGGVVNFEAIKAMKFAAS